MKRNRKLSCLAAGLAVAAAAGCGIGYRVTAGNAQTQVTSAPVKATEQAEHTSDTFSEEGTTQIQTQSQSVTFAVNTVTMTVEEVYAEAGSAVTKGDALLKFTDESIADATAYYEELVADAESALYTAQLAFQTGVLEAEYELQSAQMTAESAQESYEASVSALNVKVEEAKEQYDDALAELQSYETAVSGGTYYVQAGVDEKQAAINAAQEALARTQTSLEEAQSVYAAAQTAIASGLEQLSAQISANADYAALQTLAEQVAADYTAVQTAAAQLSAAQIEADTAQSTLEKANQSLESAVKEYNTNLTSANQKIAGLYTELEELQEKYDEAVRNAVTQTPEIQKTYEEAALAGKYADTEYAASLETLETAVDTAQEALDTLKEEQEALLALEGGVLCADRTATLASVSYEAEDVLSENLPPVYYCDTDTILISVEVAQEYIAKLTVGDEVSVDVTGNRGGAVRGKIYSIASSKTPGGSVSNVTYAVVAAIDNADGALSSGSSATVTFAYGEEIQHERQETGGTD